MAPCHRQFASDRKGGVMNLETSATMRQRKDRVELTLRYVENERRLLNTSADCHGQSVYRHRAGLLDELTAWYRTELRDLERAIGDLKNEQPTPSDGWRCDNRSLQASRE